VVSQAFPGDRRLGSPGKLRPILLLKVSTESPLNITDSSLIAAQVGKGPRYRYLRS
jgi:hypothetical protein